MDVVDVDAIHAARDIARTAIGRALGDRLRATYDGLTDTGGYTIDGAAIGRRALRNTCLSYLVAAGDASAVRLAKAQFDAGQNMTDVLAALWPSCRVWIARSGRMRWPRSTSPGATIRWCWTNGLPSRRCHRCRALSMPWRH